jgi:hypothetical protein
MQDHPFDHSEAALDHDAETPPDVPRHLTQAEVARRWRISPRTLERWRWLDTGPAYLKLGGTVTYRIEDVLAYEEAQRHETQTQAQHKLTGVERFALRLR